MGEQASSEETQRQPEREAHRVARHSTRVRHMRLAVPALTAGLVMTYVLSATPPRVDQAFAEQFSGVEASEDGVKLSAPRYSGEDLEGNPFEVVASTALRGRDREDGVALDNPEAKTTGRDGRTTTVTAKDGIYDETGRRMDLNRDVRLTQEGRGESLRIDTDAAEIDLETKTVRSKAEVRGKSDTVTLRADRGTVEQDGDRIVLEGGVEITLEPRPAKDDTQERDED